MPFIGHLPELIIVMLLALLVFGPKRLPEMGNAVGKTIKEFQKSMKEVTQPAETDRQLPAANTTAATVAQPVAESETK
jgi:sec-independent protein translocase protein TatA